MQLSIVLKPGSNNIYLYIDMYLYIYLLYFIFYFIFFIGGMAKFNKYEFILALCMFICL